MLQVSRKWGKDKDNDKYRDKEKVKREANGYTAGGELGE